jgi:hypothetical protein
MKYLIVLVVFVVNGSLAFADSKALEKCVADYALNSVDEHNSPNESVISESQAAKDSTFEVMSRMLKPKYAQEARLAFADAQAIGLIIQYGDEIEFIYVGVNIVDGQCQVNYGQALNTVDMSEESTKLKLVDAPKFFLNYSKQDMVQRLGESFEEIYSIVEESLSY